MATSKTSNSKDEFQTKEFIKSIGDGTVDNSTQAKGEGEAISSEELEELCLRCRALKVTEREFLEAREQARTLTLEETRKLVKSIQKLHSRDPNFPMEIIESMEQFLANQEIFNRPEEHERIIEEMKIQTMVITSNSPYPEVRAVVDNHDDPTLPVSTIRAWVIGIWFAIWVSFINSFFDIRFPQIYVSEAVPQLLAYPLGKFLERVLPDKGFTLFGVRHSLNPGPFNKKEHMLITIMSNVSTGVPYTNYIIWLQAIPRWFYQPWAKSPAYQILIGLSTNFIGYGLAGLCRRFLVYPAHCVWPSSLVTIAMNTAFHDTSVDSARVVGPLKTVWKMSRLRMFAWAFGLMFVYFWFPNYIFEAMSYWSWMTWISPENADLTRITGTKSGLGLNPLPTLDWNIATANCDPLALPFFTTFNWFIGCFVGGLCILAFYYTNSFNTAYLPINSNKSYDHFGKIYNVTAIIDERGIFDAEKYAAYSPPFMTAANVVVYMLFFALYSATICYGGLYHGREIMLGLKDFWRSARRSLRWRKKNGEGGAESEEISDTSKLDVHQRLMSAYKEVPEWWYMITLAVAVVLGMVGVGVFPTQTTPFVVLYGIALCLVFVVPIGIIAGMTGTQVTLNVLAEFIGGMWVEGNAIAMCFFKTYGYVTCAHALSFSKDLKLAHYVKIPQKFTFWAQMVPTLTSTFISIAVLQYQVNIPKVCTDEAPFRFECAGVNTFFTAAVFWGTVGPRKVWGAGGPYAVTLVGFPIGCILVAAFYFLGKKWPNNAVLRNAHPVVMISGGTGWAPYNLAHIWPAVPVGAFSWLYLKKRFLPLWSKYNYVISASFSCAVAIASIVIFIALQVWEIELHWWGNDIVGKGCEKGNCVLETLPEGEYFGPRIGEFS